MDSPARPTPSSPMALPIFRGLWLANIVSQFGGLIQSIGAAWAMTSLTDSPTMVALVQSSVTLPIMLLALPAGAIADSLNRRTVMLCAQSGMLLLSIILCVVAYLGLLSPWLLLMFTFAIGMGTALNAPSWQASVGDIVPRALLPRAVQLNAVGFNAARSVGPAIGGIIVAAGGAAAAFVVNAFSYLGLIGMLLKWQPAAKPDSLPREPFGRAIETGIRYAAMSPPVRRVLLRGGMFGLTAATISALVPLIVRDQLQGGPAVFGILMAAFGLGSVLGVLISSRIRGKVAAEQLVTVSNMLLAGGTIVTGLSHVLPLTILAMMIAGGGWVLAISTFNVTVQMAVPRWVVGRSVALYQMCTFGTMAAGAWIFGELAGWQGVATALLVSGGLQAVLGLVGRWLPMPDTTALDLDPLLSWREPELAVHPEPRSGPISIRVRYRIDPSDLPEFLELMAERRRIRIRDGAREWALMRDLSATDLWEERYQVATWIDYVRHMERRTRDDVGPFARLHALHRGEEGPVVHRLLEVKPGYAANPERVELNHIDVGGSDISGHP